MRHASNTGYLGRLGGRTAVADVRAQLVRGGVGSIGIKIGQLTLGLLVTVVLARTLGTEGYGLYIYVFTIVTIVAIPAQVGLPILLVRETARAQAVKDWPRLKGVWRWATSVTGALALLLSLIAAGIAWTLTDRFTPLQLQTFAWGLLLLPLVALGNLRGAALRGLRKVIQGQLPEAILRPLLLILSVIAAALLLPGAVTAPRAMFLHVVAAFIAFLIGADLLRRNAPAELATVDRPVYDHRTWLASTLPLALIGGMQVVIRRTDIIMLGLFLTIRDVGIYAVAVQGARLVSFGLTAIGMVTTPYFARMYETNDMAGFQELATMSARAMFVLALPIAAVLIICGHFLLTVLFGPDFSVAYAALAILSVAHVVHAGFGSVGPLLNMTGYERVTAGRIAVAAASNVVLNLILIPSWGLVGAALATGGTLLVWNVLLWHAAHARLGVESSILGNFFGR